MGARQGGLNTKSGRDDQPGMHEYTDQPGRVQPIRVQPIRGLRSESRQLQTERQANWARGIKVKPDQDPVYRSTGHPCVSVQ